MSDTIKRGRRGWLNTAVFLLLGLSVFFMLYGCNGAIKQYVRPNYDISAIKTVAVLPFENFTSDNFADEKIRTKIGIELLSRDISIIEPGEIFMALKDLKVKSVDAVRSSDIVNLGKMLNADAVLTGAVESYGISKGITASYPEVSVHLILFDSVTGKVVWSAWRTSGGASFWTRHFGAEGSTLDNVSEKVIKGAFDSLYGN